MSSRNEVVKVAQSWLGLNESDGSYKKIIDIYNSFTGKFPRGLKMQYSWSWCACTWSAIAIKLGYTDIMPIEISCELLIEKAKSMGIWNENDGYVPLPGDAILYDWQDNGKGDCAGWADHVGVIEYVNTSSGYMVVIEGNYKDSVKKRTISINGRYIRGFITPDYSWNSVETVKPSKNAKIETVAREVIAGLYGSGADRKRLLEKNGYDYAKVQEKVNEILNGNKEPIQPITKTVTSSCYAKKQSDALKKEFITTANVYCRNDAGTNKKALCLIPRGSSVVCYGFYTQINGVKWLLVNVALGDTTYQGFVCESYLK